MSLLNYGVLKGKLEGFRPSDKNDRTPHVEVGIKADGAAFQIAINVLSKEFPSEILYFVSEDFKSGNITILPTLDFGFTAINRNNREIALDYVRGGLFDPCKMIPLPPDKNGPDNDLNEKIQHYMQEAEEKSAIIYAFGDKFPGGIHDIHMNQGNISKYRKDDGIWQDGGVLIHFEAEERWVGIFLAFQSQSWCTDDKGHPEQPADECNHLNTPICEEFYSTSENHGER